MNSNYEYSLRLYKHFKFDIFIYGVPVIYLYVLVNPLVGLCTSGLSSYCGIPFSGIDITHVVVSGVEERGNKTKPIQKI